jgi:hypothetical protein
MKVNRAIGKFLEGDGKNGGRKPDQRYASFDFCYNYFYSFYKNGKIGALANEENLQMSCFQLGFYLASWGMMRGSAFLLERSVGHLKNLIFAISKMPPELWEIDVDKYDEKNIDCLLDCREKIIDALGRDNATSWDTLATKIMLGVFANVPAFDQYFKKSLKVSSVNRKSLYKIKEFYNENKDDFDSFKIYTYDFLTSKETNIVYTKAKLVDMCGFVGDR